MSDHSDDAVGLSDSFIEDTIEEAGLQEVEVDQRALVNMLSRYPGTFDVLRELIQNADDAEAHNIEIHFETYETEEPQSVTTEIDVSKLSVRKWVIKNDGSNFQEKDWKRLGRIADGNDNSTKVGAFGVGFYSVLSKSDRPLVKSNGSGNSLQFYRGEEDGKLRKRFAECQTDSWTSVELELRNPDPVPALADLTRFLVSSVAFLANIDAISIHLDGQRALHITKQVKPLVEISVPQHLKRTSPSQTLIVESIQHTVQRIAVDAVEWAFTSGSASSSSAVDATDVLVERTGRSEDARPRRAFRRATSLLEDNAITHDLYTAVICVNLDEQSEMRKGVESSLKTLPSSFKCKAVYFNSEQSLAGIGISKSLKAKQFARLFCGPQGIFPEDEGGRLFIGQSTNQTTGIGLHVSAHFLPTMERGAIDLANGQIKAWNEEVLWTCGFLARIIYEEEMGIAARSKDDVATQLGLCTMARFTFGPTVPHGGVSYILQEAFFSCCHKPESPFPVVSDVGISCASHPHFRQRNKDLPFLKRYRVLHEEVEPRQHSQIITRYKTPLFKYGDIVKEFESGVTQDAMKLFFFWWEDVSRNTPSTPASKNAREKFCEQFASRGVVRSNDGVQIAFKNIKHFTFIRLPDDISPPDTIQIDAASGVPTKGAIERFGWTQLPLLHWLKYACSRAQQFDEDSDVGYRILRVLVQFAFVEDLRQLEGVTDLMENLKCIPTNMGLQLPANSYIDEADVCRSLPVAREVDFLAIQPTLVANERGFEPRIVDLRHVRTVLSRIRVRGMMDWDEMIRKLEVVASEETNYRLLRYLIIHYRGQLNKQQVNDLKEKRVFYSENHGRASATELLMANEDIRKLGLPILALTRDSITDLQHYSDQLGFRSVAASLHIVFELGSLAVEPFIEALGIQRYPTLKKIITLAASDKPEVRQPALHYFLSNPEKRYDAYKAEDFAKVAFIPTKCRSLACPNEVFASPVWENLGFKQVSEYLRRDVSRLGIKDDPSVDTVIEYLKVPARTLPDLATARVWFEQLYLHGKLSTKELREQLSEIAFVPVENPESSSDSSLFKYIPPKDCFIPSTETKEHHRGIFPFVDFGQDGNSFLDSCCAKKSPDASDIARKIVENPHGYLKALGDNTALYLDDLRTIASRLDSIPEDDKQAMRKAPMFLAERHGVPVKDLLLAEQVLISDWESRNFGGGVFVAPKDDTLAKMYRELGSESLGKYVRHDITPTSHKADADVPFNRDQVIRRIRCLMKQKDASGRTGVSFGDEDSTHDLRVKACKGLTLKRTFAPPFGDSNESGRVQVKAGFEFDEGDKSYTLWMVRGPSESGDLREDIAVALCHVLLKHYGPNDVFLLASLFAMNDGRLGEYYSSDTRCDMPIVPNKGAESKTKVKVEVSLPPALAKLLNLTKPTIWRLVGKSTLSGKDGMEKAIEMWTGSDPSATLADFSAPSRPHRNDSKKQNNTCKQVHAVMLKEKQELRDAKTGIAFFLARDAKCQRPPENALQEFARLVSDLAHVFGRRDARTACYVFWKDADDDLMAFNRDQTAVFFNLAHYYKFFYIERVERRQTVTEWYLIMAHEIAHMATMCHDEEHGSISARLAVTFFPKLRAHFRDVAW